MSSEVEIAVWVHGVEQGRVPIHGHDVGSAELGRINNLIHTGVIGADAAGLAVLAEMTAAAERMATVLDMAERALGGEWKSPQLRDRVRTRMQRLRAGYFAP